MLLRRLATKINSFSYARTTHELRNAHTIECNGTHTHSKAEFDQNNDLIATNDNDQPEVLNPTIVINLEHGQKTDEISLCYLHADVGRMQFHSIGHSISW